MISWNIEGWKRNCFNLLSFVDKFCPQLIFLSEPQMFQCDVSQFSSMFHGRFCSHLNSEDSFCPELPLAARKAKGGTMALWESSLDPYVKMRIN